MCEHQAADGTDCPRTMQCCLGNIRRCEGPANGAYLDLDLLDFLLVDVLLIFFESDFFLPSFLSLDFWSPDFESLFFSPSLSFELRFRFLSLSDLKSVSYQPVPLNLKLGAETSFSNLFAPHSGHFFSGGSLIFCSSSTTAPQAWHWYS